jgi:hypothetical protein
MGFSSPTCVEGFVMRIAALLACVYYWLLLTVLLLVPNPAALVGLHAIPIFPWGKFGVHLIAFTILAALVCATRWPNRLGWPLIVFLVVYGITTESLQLLVPHRTARVMDGIENILGIAAGSGIYWFVQRLMQHRFMHLNLAAELVKYAARENATAEWRWLPFLPGDPRERLPEAARVSSAYSGRRIGLPGRS